MKASADRRKPWSLRRISRLPGFALTLLLVPLPSAAQVAQNAFPPATAETQGLSTEALAEFEPDSRFWYTDSGTDALGALVEAVSRSKLDDFVREELRKPLGMSESFYFLDDEDPRRGRIATLYGKRPDGWGTLIDPDEGAFYPFAWGAQSLYSTPADYAKFLAMWMDGGRVSDRALLSDSAVARTLRPVSEMTLPLSSARRPTSFAGMEVYYGQMAMLLLSVEVGGTGPATIIGHTGADGTMALAWPERDLMVLFFAQQRGANVTLRVEEALDRFLIAPEAYADASEIPQQLAPYPGTYIADWGSHMKEESTVHVKTDQLWIDIPTTGNLELVPGEEEGRWSLAAAPEIGVWFERDEDGAVDCVRIQEGPFVHEAPRKGTPRQVKVLEANRADPKALAPYIGMCDDPGTERNARIFIDLDYLALEGGSGNVVHLWRYPGTEAWSVREREGLTLSFQKEEGTVVGFTLQMVGVAGDSPIFRRIR